MIEELAKMIDMLKSVNISLVAIIVVGLGFAVILVALSKQ